MKVIFDISTVGADPKTRTGLARVAWSLANEMYQKFGNDISFSSTGSIESSLQTQKLLSFHPHLQSAIHPIGDLVQRIKNLERRIPEKSDQASTLNELLRYFFLCLSRALNVVRTPINPQLLSDADIFHSPYARIPDQVRKVLPNHHLQTVHDLTPLILPSYYFGKGQKSITQRIIDTIQPNDWVTTVSNATRNDLLNRRPLNPERVITIYNAASPELFYPVSDFNIRDRVRMKYGIPPGRFFLSLHSLSPHKNMKHLISCFKINMMQEKIKDIHLVICGGNENSIYLTIKENKLNEKDLKYIHFTGFVDDFDLAGIYSSAVAFVFPSLYEGFGLPVIEAMQCGCPIIASNTSSLPEVVGDAGFLVNPYDQEELCQALLKLFVDSEACYSYSKLSLARAELFSWKKSAKMYLEYYKKIMES